MLFYPKSQFYKSSRIYKILKRLLLTNAEFSDFEINPLSIIGFRKFPWIVPLYDDRYMLRFGGWVHVDSFMDLQVIRYYDSFQQMNDYNFNNNTEDKILTMELEISSYDICKRRLTIRTGMLKTDAIKYVNSFQFVIPLKRYREKKPIF